MFLADPAVVDGGGMNSMLHRGVAKKPQLMPYRQAVNAEIALFADLTGANPSF